MRKQQNYKEQLLSGCCKTHRGHQHVFTSTGKCRIIGQMVSKNFPLFYGPQEPLLSVYVYEVWVHLGKTLETRSLFPIVQRICSMMQRKLPKRNSEAYKLL